MSVLFDKWWNVTILHEIGPRVTVVGVYWQIKCVKGKILKEINNLFKFRLNVDEKLW
jgi:hypothetical protein